MSLLLSVTVDVQGRGPVFHARCYAEQLPATLAVAAEALLSQAKWIAEMGAGFTFEVRPA